MWVDVGDEDPEEVVDAEEVGAWVDEEAYEWFVAFGQVDHLFFELVFGLLLKDYYRAKGCHWGEGLFIG